MCKHFIHYLIVTAAAAVATSSASARETLISPDGRLQATFDLIDGKPSYSLEYDGKPVVLPSFLGLDLKGETPLTPEVIFRP